MPSYSPLGILVIVLNSKLIFGFLKWDTRLIPLPIIFIQQSPKPETSRYFEFPAEIWPFSAPAPQAQVFFGPNLIPFVFLPTTEDWAQIFFRGLRSELGLLGEEALMLPLCYEAISPLTSTSFSLSCSAGLTFLWMCCHLNSGLTSLVQMTHYDVMMQWFLFSKNWQTHFSNETDI